MTTTLFIASRFHTMTGAVEEITGVLVDGARIIAVGSATELAAGFAGEIVDFGDAVVTPGLVDGHAHPVFGQSFTLGVDLTEMLDLESVSQVLLEARNGLAAGEWLLAWGLNPVVFGSSKASTAALGLAVDGIAASIRMYDGHSILASPEALTFAGIDAAREFSSTAEIVVDAGGVPTGYLLEEEAIELVLDVIPRPPLNEQVASLRELLAGMAASGLTGLHVMDLFDPTLELVRMLEQTGELPLKIGFNPRLDPADSGPDDVIRAQELRGRRWRVEGVKMLIDGTVDGGSAWLEYPDTRGEGVSGLWRDFSAFRERVTALHRAGVNVAVHAIGDRGVREVLELFTELRQEFGPLARHRIEHVETITDDVVALFGQGAAAASMQPLHCTYYNVADGSDSWSQRLGDIRVDHGFRWGDIRAAGGVVALGSDWPIAPYDPRWTMADAQLRRRFDNPELEPIFAEQALTALQALEGYTTHAALASGEESHRGQIAIGFDADFTVFAGDPLTVSPEELGTLPVIATVVDGRVVTI